MRKRLYTSQVIVFVLVLFCFATSPISAQEINEDRLQLLVDRAKLTFEEFVADPNMRWFRENLKDAKALLIIPRLGKGGFIVGGSGGSGTLVALDEKTGKWSNPAFYTMGSVTFGLQIGGAAEAVVVMVRTKKGLDKLLASSMKLGADASAAAGPTGGGSGAATADILSFAKSKGAYIGATVQGAVVGTKDKWNEAYYGKPVRPVDILILRKVNNPKADKLQAALEKATK